MAPGWLRATDVKPGLREGKRLAGSHTAAGGQDSNAPLCVEKRVRVPWGRQVKRLARRISEGRSKRRKAKDKWG